MNKKGFFGSLVPAVLTLIISSILLILGVVILLQVGNNTASVGGNATATALAGYLGTSSGGFGSWWPILIIIFVAAIIFGAFGVRLAGNSGSY